MDQRNLKRKFQESFQNEASIFGLDELNQDLLERVLSWLPTSSFCRLTSVSKRWKAAADSPTFRRACSEIPSRDPWFYMVDSQPPRHRPPVVYDSSEKNWKVLSYPSFHSPDDYSCSDFAPVAAAGGLLCFHSESDGFIVSNPVTGIFRRIPSPDSDHSPLQAIAMSSNANSYKLVLVSGEFPKLCFRVYDSGENKWREKSFLRRKCAGDSSSGPEDSNSGDEIDEYPLYFLSKCGNLVSPELQRSPCKQYSSVISSNSGEETVFFLSHSGTVVACNLAGKYFVEYPKLLPLHLEYSIDLVQCRGEVFAVALSDYLESASLRVWRFNGEWEQVAAMPPAMSHEFYGKAVDVNCAGAGDRIFVCASCTEYCRYFVCDLKGNEWVELPNGNGNEFSCAISFEPRIEAST